MLSIASCSPHLIEKEPIPTASIPNAYASIETVDPTVKAMAEKPWWQNFDRPTLSTMIERGILNNQNVTAALARVKQARALAIQTNAGRLPQIDIEGDASKTYRGSDGQRGTASIGPALDWEVDIWDRVGSATQADRLETRARGYDVNALRLSLSADIANAYFGAAAAHQRLQLLKEQLKLDNDLQGLLELRLENGVGTSVDVMQQAARVADSETLIPRAESDLAVFENRLDVLLGTTPDAQFRVPADENLDFAQDMPPIGVPAALLLNRPDLQAAQARLVAADADIAAAIADRFPRITIDASYAYTDTAVYTGPVSALMASFVQPLLDWGERKAAVEENKALYEEQLALFTQNYLEAVEDVENALIQEKKQREFLTRLEKRRDILQKTVNASEDRYTQGIDDYLPVINALQELRQVERDLISERLNLVSIRINLYRAIGGPIAIDPYALNKNKDTTL